MTEKNLIALLNGIEDSKKYLTQLSIMRQYAFHINDVMYTCLDLRNAIEKYEETNPL